jgi:hypothetical protein
MVESPLGWVAALWSGVPRSLLARDVLALKAQVDERLPG